MYQQVCTPLILLFGGLLFGLPTLRAIQETPPVTGTIALEGTVNKTYAAANTIIVKTMDGVEHLFHFTRRTVVHGAKDTGDAAFSGLVDGSRVVVHYAVDGADKTAVEVDRIDESGLRVMEGVVTRIDREGKTLAIRLADGSTETLRLSERAAGTVGKDVDRAAEDSAKVIVYYADEAGHRVAHYFRKIS
jgi:hypothetical protein